MWPTLITRYLVLELLKVFVAALVILTFVLMLVGLVQEAVRQGLNPLLILRMIPYALPNALVFALPGTILLSICSVFGRMSAANEIVAMKALGISPIMIIRPALILALCLSLLSVWIIDIAYSWGYSGIQRVVRDSVVEVAYGVLRSQRSYSSSQFSIHVAQVEGQRLISPTIVVRRTNGEDITMSVREAELRVSPVNGELIVLLTEGNIEVRKSAAMWFSDTIEQVIPTTGIDGGGIESIHPAHLRMSDIPQAKKLEIDRIQSMEQSMALKASTSILEGNFDELLDAQWQAKVAEIDQHCYRLRRLTIEPLRRWASGFSCLAFAAIGIPVAIRLELRTS